MEWNQTGLGVETVGGCRHCEEDGDRQTDRRTDVHTPGQTDRQTQRRTGGGWGGWGLLGSRVTFLGAVGIKNEQNGRNEREKEI